MTMTAKRQSVPPTTTPPRPIEAIGSTLGTIAIAIGIGVLGYYMLDGHRHTCESCGNHWRHLGAFNFGDPTSHTCKECGTVQWWKDGMPHVFRAAIQSYPSLPRSSPNALPIASRLASVSCQHELSLVHPVMKEQKT